MTFNPFKYIFTLEGFLEPSGDSSEPSGDSSETIYDKDKLKSIIEIIKANKDKPDCITIIDEEIKKIESIKGGATELHPKGDPEADKTSNTLRAEIDKLINSADNIINGVTKSKDSDLLIVNINHKIAAMARIARDTDEDNSKSDKNLHELADTVNYLLEQLTAYKLILTETKDPTIIQNIATHQGDIDNAIKSVTQANEKVRAATSPKNRPVENIDSMDYVKESTTIIIPPLAEMINTQDTPLNIAAVKAILACAIAFSAIACLSLLDHTDKNKVLESGKKSVEGILKITLDLIYSKINPDSGDINTRIKETIIFLKKMCNPKNMMETFMEIVYKIETPEASIVAEPGPEPGPEPVAE